VSAERLAHHLPVLGERVAIGIHSELFEQLRRPLDVRAVRPTPERASARRDGRSRGRVGRCSGAIVLQPIARKEARSTSADNPVRGSPETDGDACNGGPLRKRSRGGGACRRSASNDRANDEYIAHHDRDHDDDIDNDERGDDDYPCGDHDDDDGGADLSDYRLITVSEGDSRSPSWGERVRCAVRERATGASAS
jgi:hypothetical protein